MRLIQVLTLGMVLASWTVAYADAKDVLQVYAEQCKEATGIDVPAFNCDAGTKVPTTVDGKPATATYRPAFDCDRPNVLNHECDPESHFQVLEKTDDAVVVAHCRKQGLNAGEYGDIAVIQHNSKNGATCFYQALAGWVDDNTREKATKPLKGKDIKAPSDGLGAWSWMTPAATAAVGCGGCHDNGPIIRSPYLTQITEKTDPPKKNMLPGAGDFFNGSGNPYYFVGEDSSPWRAYEVKVENNLCNACHRMGVSNVKAFGTSDLGTARDLGPIATAASQEHKRPHSASSPLWMIRDIMSVPETFTTKHSQANADAAKAIKDCADTFNKDGPSLQKPSSLPGCTITQFASRWKLAAVRWLGAQAHFFMGHRYSLYDAKVDNTKAGDPISIDKDWPESWTGGIDAALLWNENIAYFFKGREYIKYDVKAKKKAHPRYPLLIKDHWHGVWADGVDAAVPWTNGKVYFFKGAEYIQYDVKGDTTDPGFPKPIKGNWPGLEKLGGENGIDAVICWNATTAYFFKGDQYVRYNMAETDNNKKVSGPFPIKGNWPHVKWEKG